MIHLWEPSQTKKNVGYSILYTFLFKLILIQSVSIEKVQAPTVVAFVNGLELCCETYPYTFSISQMLLFYRYFIQVFDLITFYVERFIDRLHIDPYSYRSLFPVTVFPPEDFHLFVKAKVFCTASELAPSVSYAILFSVLRLVLQHILFQVIHVDNYLSKIIFCLTGILIRTRYFR